MLCFFVALCSALECSLGDSRKADLEKAQSSPAQAVPNPQKTQALMESCALVTLRSHDVFFFLLVFLLCSKRYVIGVGPGKYLTMRTT